MESIGIKLLRENLSEYIARARSGERIIITDHGEEVTELVPISAERQALAHLIAQGRMRWSGREAEFLPPLIKAEGSPFSDAIIEERDASLP